MVSHFGRRQPLQRPPFLGTVQELRTVGAALDSSILFARLSVRPRHLSVNLAYNRVSDVGANALAAWHTRPSKAGNAGVPALEIRLPYAHGYRS